MGKKSEYFEKKSFCVYPFSIIYVYLRHMDVTLIKYEIARIVIG